MAFNQNQLDALNAAIASGELSVKYDGKEVTYRSISELLRARNLVLAELEAAVPRRSNSIAYINRG